MFGVLPFLFAILIIQSSTEVEAALPLFGVGQSLVTIIASSLALWFVVSAAIGHLIARRGRHRLLRNWDFLAQVLILLWLRWLCVHLGWTKASHITSIALLPFAAALMIHWWNLTEAVRSVTGHHWTRPAMVIHHLRFSAMPLLMAVSLFMDGVDFATRHISLPKDVPEPVIAAAGWLGSNALLIGMFLFMPTLLVRLWGAQSLPPGQLRHGLQQACASMGVKVAKLMRWPVRGGRMYNAAVVGVIPRFRYVLFTDDLLRDLDHRQLMAVLGHELGHARYGHLWLYLIFMNIALALVGFASRLDLAGVVDRVIPEFTRLDAADRQLIVGLLVVGALFRLAFGVISRACERQADLAGAELAGDYGAMQEALKSVALLSGQPENAPNWRHYSIAERIAFLQRVRQQPALAAEHHRLMGSMRFSLVVLLVILLLSLAAEYFLDPRRQAGATNDPNKIIELLARNDPDLETALFEADQGNITNLVKWLNRSSELERQRVAQLHIRLIDLADGKPEESSLADDRKIYQLRFRLRAFVNISTGLPEFDLIMANVLAYGLVAGTEHPTKQDIDLARQLVDRLEPPNRRRPDQAICDTIGCVHFVTGEYESALSQFTTASQLLPKADRVKPEEKRKTEDLYRRRVAAAEHNLAAAQAKSGDFWPLPLAEETPIEKKPDATTP